MLQSERIHIETEFEDRVQFILQDYQYLREDKPLFLECLKVEGTDLILQFTKALLATCRQLCYKTAM